MTFNPSKGNTLFSGAAASIFAMSIFLAASLSFVIEPLIGKIFLPLLGGSPNVWNTCVLFFQAVLLLGYIYAHILTTKVSPRRQLIVHLFIVWLPALTLPLAVPKGAPSNDHPIVWLLSALLSIVGSVFFAATATNPLLQKWYSTSNFILSKDPYFLFAASNAGSLLGLLCYPFLIEPSFTIAQQTNLVSTSYLVYAALITACILLVLKAGMNAPQETDEPAANRGTSTETSKENTRQLETDKATGRLEAQHYGRWLLLTALPSSLMLGITTYITQELSPFPLLWIIPLSIYLLSFIIAFSRLPRWLIRLIAAVAPLFVLATLTLLTSDEALIQVSTAGSTVTDKISLHVLTLFVLCTACHGLLAIERPAPAYLTHFYLTISIGGLIGSSFNSLIAPTIFNAWIEYPLALCLAGIALSAWPDNPKLRTILRLKDYGPRTNKMMYILIPVFVAEGCFLADLLKFCIFRDNYQKLDVGNFSTDFVFQLLIPIGICVLISRNTPQMRLGLAALAMCLLMRVSTRDPNVVSRARNF
ncbi:MAG: hypothetical protein K2Z81_25020, partial [Cyanobacteria bacterium]|nr:hypothetical protein [Cyanobacteriota bacterium]